MSNPRITTGKAVTHKMVTKGETHGYKPSGKPARPAAKPPAPPTGQGGGSK